MKKSQAMIPPACARRNSVQVGPVRRGAGPSRAVRSRVRIGPEARLVTVLDSTGDSRRRAIVAFPPFRVFPSRDGIDLPGEGHWRFDSLPRQIPRSAYAKRIPREVDPKDLLWEVVIVSDI